ncbi:MULTISPECIES: hypothetical protein [Streptomyces]|uniref:Uncharacterized protein n=1 Tax=Streptomyces chilikensis TaxID=1194079 RepID=A0ABV3EHY9_9ACTN|nr:MULTISPECIES: hypothetical protein [Streptomyces]MDH6228420.1 hypothetical protein [Streptomyces sp. MJP52]
MTGGHGSELRIKELLDRLHWHAAHVAMACAARDRLVLQARYEGADAGEVGDAAGLSVPRARALAREAVAPSRLRPGPHLRVPPRLLADDEVLAAALTGLYARLVGVVPPQEWSRAELEEELTVGVAPRMPAGHHWRLTVDEAGGGFAYGVWPDTAG